MNNIYIYTLYNIYIHLFICMYINYKHIHNHQTTRWFNTKYHPPFLSRPSFLVRWRRAAPWPNGSTTTGMRRRCHGHDMPTMGRSFGRLKLFQMIDPIVVLIASHNVSQLRLVHLQYDISLQLFSYVCIMQCNMHMCYHYPYITIYIYVYIEDLHRFTAIEFHDSSDMFPPEKITTSLCNLAQGMRPELRSG